MSDKAKAKRDAIDADITRLLDRAANDRSDSGMIGLGATWLAASMYTLSHTLEQNSKESKRTHD